MKKVLTLIAALVVSCVAFAQVTEVTISEVSTKFYSEDNDLYIMMVSDDETYVFYFDVVCPTGETDITDGVTYTYANDMIADYSLLADYGLGQYVAYTSASLVRSAGNYDVTVADEQGRNFHLTYTYVPPITEPKDTVAVDLTNTTYQNRVYDYTATETGAFQLIGISDEWLMNVVFTSTTFAGNYTLDNMYNKSYMCLYSIQSGDTTLIPLSNVTASVAGNATNCTATVNYIGKDSTLYVVSFAYADPYAAETKQFNSTNAVFDMQYWENMMSYYGYGAYTIQATDAEYMLYAEVYATDGNERYEGAYADDQVSLAFYNVDGTELMYEGWTSTLNVTTGAATGSALCYGNVLFDINLSGTDAVENAVASNYVVLTEKGAAVIVGAEGQVVSVYDMTGRLVSKNLINSDNARIEIAVPGVYAINVNGETHRVVVK